MMTRGLGVLVLVALACGGRGRDPDAEPATTEETEAGPETAAQSSATSHLAEADPAAVCLGLPDVEVPGFCRTCLGGAFPRCLSAPVPKPDVEPAACGAPSCGLAPNTDTSSYFFPDEYFESAGECSDGKTFIAQLGRFRGVIVYFRDADGQVGSAAYTSTITDCACSGESVSGDVLCPSPTFETAPPDGEVKFPFADGHRAAPCMCAD
jgi:hypothetical protein